MLNYDFMQNAFIAGTIVSIMAGYIGVFVMARNMSFISHTLSRVGFAGAAFAVFLGIIWATYFYNNNVIFSRSS